MIKLQLKFKDMVLKEFVTDKNEIAIGRDASNDLCIDNLAASSQHARVFKGPDNNYAIEDLNSTNGTYVNGKQIMTQVLNNNDRVTIGKHILHVIYQEDNAFKEQRSNRVTQSTYMLDPKERENLTQ